jgi:hypothetical protein
VHNRAPMLSGISLARRFGRVGVLAVLTLVVTLAGCGSATDDRPVQWSYVYPAIIEPSCATASCHSDIVRRSGVNLGDQDTAYSQLLTRHFVIQNADPAKAVTDSELIYLLNAQGARRMPPDFALPKDDIDLITKWIAAGAKQD